MGHTWEWVEGQAVTWLGCTSRIPTSVYPTVRSLFSLGTHFLGATCHRGHGIPRPNVEATLPAGASLLREPREIGEGAKEHRGRRVPLAMLGPPTQVGDIMRYVKFIQTVTSFPRLDDWAKRFGSSNGQWIPRKYGTRAPLASGGLWRGRELSPVFSSLLQEPLLCLA